MGDEQPSDRAEVMRQRTKRFALDVLRSSRTWPRDEASRVIVRQVLRSATSVAANYRAACRACTTPAFIAKLDIVVEEADETEFWLGLLSDLEPSVRLDTLRDEATQLTKIFSASRRTARSNQANH